jgi:hypothetical protein
MGTVRTWISEGGVLSRARNCGALERLNSVQQFLMAHAMEEPGEQCTVVFTLIVTELASECGRRGGGGSYPQTLAVSITIYAKTTVHYSPDSYMAHAKKWEMIEIHVIKPFAR